MEIHVPITLSIFHYLFFVHNQPEYVSDQHPQLRRWLLCEQTWGTARAGLLPYSLGTLARKAEQENQPTKTRHDSTAPGKERASVLPGDAIWTVWPDITAGSFAVQFAAITSWKETRNTAIASMFKRLVPVYRLYESFNQWASCRLLCICRSPEGISREVLESLM